MGKHARDIPETDARPQPATALEENAQMHELDMRFLLNYIAITHPLVYAEAREEQAALAARNAAYIARQREQDTAAVTAGLDAGDGGVWTAYADAIQAAEDRAAQEAGNGA